MAKKNGKIKWNREGFRLLRQEPAIRDLLLEKAEEIARHAASYGDGADVFRNAPGDGDSGYQITDLVLEDPRGAVSVMAVGHGRMHNRKHNALLRGVSKVARGG